MKWTEKSLKDFEKEIVDLYLDCKLPFLFHLSGGNEKELLEIFKDIKEGDYVITNHRGHYHVLLHGMKPDLHRTPRMQLSLGTFQALAQTDQSRLIGPHSSQV